jgi:glycosyltransferase involved in cell wall biosynthesis
VTVGVCVRNCEKSIKEAIASIIAQDYPHDKIRLVFVDESEDNTLSIIRSGTKGIDIDSIILHTSRKGLGAARDMVLARSKGDYVLWVDGDMIISPVFLRRLVDFMENNPRAGVVKGKQALLPAANLLATLESHSRAAGRMIDYQSQKGFSKVVGTAGALYRTKAIAEVGGFDPELKYYNEDWDAELKLREAGWSMHTLDVFYQDYERQGLTWKSLWCRYWLRGYHTGFFLQKHRGLIKHYRMLPNSAFLSGLLSSAKLFKLTRNKKVFLIPFQSFFKMTAWYVGFVRNRIKKAASQNR